MAVIKSCEASQLIPFSFEDVEAEAEQLKLTAEAQGRDVGIAAGIEEGRAAGREEGLHESRQMLSDAITSLSVAATQLQLTRRQLELDLGRDVVTLAAAIARRVAKRQGLIDPEMLAANIHDAMKLVVDRGDVRIAIHPSQRATLEDALPRLKIDWPQLNGAEIVDDPAIAPGGCRVSTAAGQVDADIDTQLDRVIDELMPARGMR